MRPVGLGSVTSQPAESCQANDGKSQQRRSWITDCNSSASRAVLTQAISLEFRGKYGKLHRSRF